MSDDRKGEKNNFYGKKHTLETKSKLREIALTRVKPTKTWKKVEIVDIKTGITTLYPSLRKACAAIGTTLAVILRRNKNEKAQGKHPVVKDT